MDRYTEAFETWNKVAQLYQNMFMDLDIYNGTYDFFCDLITNNNPQILEIGCGPGNITKYLLTVKPNFKIAGIDIAPNMVALAKKNNPSASFAIMDTRHINEITTKYNGIIAGFCLPYLSYADCEKLIADCYNLLHVDGILYISFVEGNPTKSNFKTSSTGNRVYFYYYNLQYLITLISNHNFEHLKTFKVDFKRNENEIEEHTILIVKKKIVL